MRMLMLGGTRFVGTALVSDALSRGWEVTAFHRGQSGSVPDGVESVIGDRRNPDDVAGLARGEWDLVVDAWYGVPRVVSDAANALAPVAERFLYVSSISVHQGPIVTGLNEDSPVVEADPDADGIPDREGNSYPADKRGGELAALRAFGEDRVILGRAGVILGPWDDRLRLPYWINRAASGGDVLAPEPADRELQYIDVRDLAAFLLDLAAAKESGAYDVVGPTGMTTMRELLETCVEVTGAGARLVWIDQDFLLECGLGPWMEAPLWLPAGGEADGGYGVDSSRSLAAGMTWRPVRDTVVDTWTWLSTLDAMPTTGEDRISIGIDPAKEARLLREWAAHQSATQ